MTPGSVFASHAIVTGCVCAAATDGTSTHRENSDKNANRPSIKTLPGTAVEEPQWGCGRTPTWAIELPAQRCAPMRGMAAFRGGPELPFCKGPYSSDRVTTSVASEHSAGGNGVMGCNWIST